MAALIRTGAILFTDMVSSTQLRMRLGDERAEVLRKHHDELLARCVAAHHGEVLRWTGDGIKAAFGSASDALAGAIAIRREIHAYGLRDDAIATFDVRIGVSAGEVIVDDGDHHGVPVVEAARLEALARPGEVLVTDLVRLLAGRGSGSDWNVVFEDAGQRTLKGLDHPVSVQRVVDTSLTTSQPLPRRLVADERLPLVGREMSLDRFTDVWRRVRAGRSQTVVLRGSAGSGRSRLLGGCARTAHDDGALVLAGACTRGQGTPYEPFVEALRDAGALDPALGAALREATGPLARLFPGTTPTRAASQPATARFELFDAVAALIRRLARARPVLLTIDDLHLASSSTTLLLSHVLDELPEERLAVVVTARTGGPDDLVAVRDALGAPGTARTGRVTVIDLPPLGEAEIVQLVHAAAPELDIVRSAEVARVVARESAGSALYASALVEHLVGGDAAPGADAGPIDRLQLPSSVQDLVAGRVEQLPTGVAEVLTVAAVIGPTFDVAVLAAVLGRPVDDVLDVVEDAQRSDLVEEVGRDRFSFAQELVRQALLDTLGTSRRSRLHRSVAEAAEQLERGDVDELAHHWREAGEESRALTHLAHAAHRDMLALAYESARARYQEVVDLLARDTGASSLARAEAWLGLGAAERALGDPAYTQAIMRAARLARTARDHRLVAEAAALSTWPGTFFFIAEAPEVELIELCEDALTTTDVDDPMRVRLLATLASHITFGSRERRVQLITEANDLLGRHDDPHLTAMVWNAEFLCLWEPATFERREQIGRDMGRLARATGDPEIEFLAGFFTAYCAVERGELSEARARLVDLATVAESSRNRYFSFLAERLVLSIDIARCEPDVSPRIDGLFHAYAATYADTEGTWPLQTGGVAYQRGTLGSMVNTMEAMTAGQKGGTWTAALALARLWAGDRDGARESLRRQGVPPRNYFWITVSQVQAEVAASLGELERCAELFDELAPFRGRVGVTASGSLLFGLVDRSLGQLALALGRVDEAIEILTDAVATADRCELPLEGVIARRLLATALRQVGRTDDVDAIVAIASETARRLDFERELALLGAAADGAR